MVAFNLPSYTFPFVGREEELVRVGSLLTDPACRLLTLLGPGGIGKTRLAVEAAQHLAFADGTYFVPLQPLRAPDLIASAIADAVGFQFYPGSDPQPQLLDYLREKSLLLVLDNFEHLLSGVGLLAEMLASAPALRMLVTSRERLSLVEEWVLEMDGLAYPAGEMESEAEHYSSVELFVQHARRAKVGFTLTDKRRAAVVRICHLVNGMPLGIELAATWVRALSCDAIADEIERSLDILESPARNMEPRHRTMRAAFEPTWARLSGEERDVFMRLSVFRGGFTREAAEKVADTSLRTLTALVDRSLVRVDASGRYDLHELLRQYGEEQISAAGGLATLRAAHSAYYALFLHKRWQPVRSHEQVRTLDEIEIEFDNVQAAWQTMVEMRNSAELSMSVYSLWYFCDLRGHYAQALTMFKQAEDALRPLAEDAEATRALGQMLTRRAWFYVELVKLDEGRALAEAGLAILRRAGSPEDIALAYYSLCNVTAFADDFQGLKRNAELMMEIARRMNDGWLIAAAHFPLANAAFYLGALAEATRIVEKGSRLADACGDLFLRAFLRSIGGSIAFKLGDYVKAKRAFEQALKLLTELGQDSTIGELHRELGVIAFHMRDYPLAASRYQEGLQILFDTGGFHHSLLGALPFVARLWIALGRREEAVELLTVAREHSESLQSTRDDAMPAFNSLQAELAPEAFASAHTRGMKLELRAVVQRLIRELGQVAQTGVVTLPELRADTLTEREREILPLVADGYSNREIADALVLAVSTVKWYLSEIFSKLDVANRTQAVVRARTLGWLP